LRKDPAVEGKEANARQLDLVASQLTTVHVVIDRMVTIRLVKDVRSIIHVSLELLTTRSETVPKLTSVESMANWFGMIH